MTISPNLERAEKTWLSEIGRGLNLFLKGMRQQSLRSELTGLGLWVMCWRKIEKRVKRIN